MSLHHHHSSNVTLLSPVLMDHSVTAGNVLNHVACGRAGESQVERRHSIEQYLFFYNMLIEFFFNISCAKTVENIML